jgi:hypothetical protein
VRPAQHVSGAAVALIGVERRLDPYFRNGFDRVFQRRLASAVQGMVNLRRRDQHLGLAEERALPGEEQVTRAIVAQMTRFLRLHYQGRHWERAGNTKTYGVLRAELEVLPDLPANLRRGLFAEARSFRAWVRFAGPGPLSPPDVDDNGILSIGVKVMGVPGPKLLDDEQFTQDLTGISCPTFTTPDVVANLDLQRHVSDGTPLLYFARHPLDGLMQGLYARTNTSPLEVRYWSCTPYLLGAGQAMQYSFRPSSDRKSPIPTPIPDDYLRQAMARTLAEGDVWFDLLVQVQTDPHGMPIENAGVEWPERLSPCVRVARLRLPSQRFDSPSQLAFAGRLSYNPWHSLPDHRPLGNQNRARRTIYLELSRLRQAMNDEPHLEPTGDEVFEKGDAS